MLVNIQIVSIITTHFTQLTKLKKLIIFHVIRFQLETLGEIEYTYKIEPEYQINL